MDRAVNAVEDEVVKGVVAFIKQQFSYLTQYHDNIQNLSSKVEELERARQAVKDKVDDAVRKRQDLILGVDTWLREAEALIKEGKEIMIKEDKAGNRCWEAWCLHLKPRYSLSVEAKKEAGKIDKHLATSTSQFRIVARQRFPSAVADGKRKIFIGSSSSSGAHGGLESRSLILTKVMEALKNDQIRMVIICGMGGVGKTKMVDDVRKLAGDLFKEIPYAEFNMEPDISKIQGKLAKSLGYDFEEAEDVSDRVPLLYERLNDEKILLVADNVWNIDDLGRVGIPLGDEIRGCKILLTSRDKNVRDPHTTDEVFNLKPLIVDEGLLLLRQCLGNTRDILPQTAEGIVNACGGLPLAVTTIAKAIQFKDEDTWKVVLGKLKDSRTSKELFADVFKALRASYNFLKNEKIKKLFRLCCLFPKGTDVPIEYLVLGGIAVNLYESARNMYEAREDTHMDIATLVQLNLLLRSDKAEYIKMHDLVWDFALSLSSEDGSFMVHFGDGIKQWPQSDSHEDYTSISLGIDNLPEVPNDMDFRNLEILKLFAGDNSSAVILPDNIYNGMSGLRFLLLEKIVDPLTPKSFRNLCKLQILWLNQCELSNDDILTIETLHKLKVLRLEGIKKLAINLGNLGGLRLLDFTGCRLQLIAPESLSGLTCLEELYMRQCEYWSDKESIEEMFTQLSNLSNLVVLVMQMSFDIPSSAVSVFHKVKKFQISINALQVDHVYFRGNSLRLSRKWILQDHKVKVLIQKAEHIEMVAVRYLELLVNESEIKHYSTIKSLIVTFCGFFFLIKTKYLHQQNVFPLLESLFLENLPFVYIYHIEDSRYSFSELASVEVPNLLTSGNLASFGKLKYLEVNICQFLRCIFPLPIAMNLVMLERLEIYFCHMMTEIIEKQERYKDLMSSVVKIHFPSLKYLSLRSLENLQGFSKAAIEVELPQLEEMILKNLDRLTSLFSTMSISDEDYDSATLLLFNQKSSYPNSAAFGGIGPSQFPAFPIFHKLSHIHISECKRLIYVFRPNVIVGLPVLQSLSISNCGSLKSVFSSFMLRSLGQLKELIIMDCEMLEVIVDENDEGAVVKDDNNLVMFSSLVTMQLIRLPNLTGFSSGNLDFEWPSLTWLEILACLKMKIFTSGCCETPVLNSLIMNLNQYYLDGDVNTTLNGVQQKDNEAFEEEGILTKNGFFIAAEHLVKEFPYNWKWGGKGVMVTRYVQFSRRATVSKFVNVEKETRECTFTSSGGGDGSSSSDANIYEYRSYNVNVTYSDECKTPCLWLKGYKYNYRYSKYVPLEKLQVLEDVIESLPLESFLMDEGNPTELGQISFYPSKMMQMSIKNNISNQYSSLPGNESKVCYYLHALLCAFAPLVPSIEIAPGNGDEPTQPC